LLLLSQGSSGTVDLHINGIGVPRVQNSNQCRSSEWYTEFQFFLRSFLSPIPLCQCTCFTYHTPCSVMKTSLRSSKPSRVTRREISIRFSRTCRTEISYKDQSQLKHKQMLKDRTFGGVMLRFPLPKYELKPKSIWKLFKRLSKPKKPIINIVCRRHCKYSRGEMHLDLLSK
jgi:hypothetical protein